VYKRQADPALGVQLSLLNQVKGLVKKGNIKVNNQVFYEGFIPYNIDMRGVQTQLLYIVEQAPTISYWTATFSNYLDVLTQDDFFLWIWNSLLITVSTAFLGVALSSTGAYAFSRFEFPGRKAGLIFLLTTQMIPAGMLMLPIWIIAFNLGLIGQWSGLVLAYSVGSIPFSIWILKGYYDTIPKELEEAATIDGATKMQTFFLIMLPLAAPALAIVFLFNFMNAWNDYLLAKIMIENRDKYTWPLGLERMQGQFNTKWGAFAAAAIMVSVPVVILFLSSSKYLVSGLTLGSVKG
jgi:arabinogalactan oligomer/maltooligosaccharide transport system permease protein